MVYVYLEETYENVRDTEDLKEAGCEDEGDLVAYVFMIPQHLRQINRQIKEEVEAQMRLDTTLVFEESDPGFFENTYPKFLRRMVAQYTNHVVLNLQVWCIDKDEDDSMLTCTKDCTAVYDISDHSYYAREFLQSFSQNLKSCEIELSLMRTHDNLKMNWTDAQHGPELLKALKKLVEIPGLTALRVYKDNIKQAVLWVSWDKRGWHVPTKKGSDVQD
jgi:hypothetical protein